jgi:hypothetical protein
MDNGMRQLSKFQPLDDVLDFMKSDESSLTLTIGNECLDQFFDDSQKAITSLPHHATEIVLASLCRRLKEMQLSSEVEELFNHVLNLIQINDQEFCA